MKDQLTLTTLDNGVKLLTYNIPEIQSVHVHIYAKGGSLVEDPAINGSAHFMEHMLLQGTPTYSSFQEIAMYIESMAGHFNASTGPQRINFYVVLPARHIQDAVLLAHDVWTRSIFPEEAFLKEKRAVLSEALTNLDSTSYKLSKYVNEKRYLPESKMRQFTIGAPDIIEKVTLKNLKDYYDTFFTSKNTYIVVVGNINAASIQKLVTETFGKDQQKDTPELFTNLNGNQFASTGAFLHHDEKLQSNYLDISMPSIPRESDRKMLIIQNLACHVVGGTITSRLPKALRLDRGLVYGANASYAVSPHVGEVSFDTEMQSEHFTEALKLFTDIITQFIQEGPTDEELDHIKNYIKDSTYMTFDEPSHVVSWFVNEFLWKPEVTFPEDTIPLMESITKEEILSFMQTYWDFSKTQIVAQGPREENTENQKLLDDCLQKFTDLKK